MNLIEKIKEEVIYESDVYKSQVLDHYDFWNEHIKYVYAEGLILAEKYGANTEIVALGALLHDIALIQQIGDKKNHHINGSIIAESILQKYDCDDVTIQKVISCVLHHRSSMNASNIEELCVADADILAHFDNIPMLFNLAFDHYHIELNQIRPWLKNAFEQDYADLSERTKMEFRPRYEQICQIVLGD